jgi:hypothetical protein
MLQGLVFCRLLEQCNASCGLQQSISHNLEHGEEQQVRLVNHFCDSASLQAYSPCFFFFISASALLSCLQDIEEEQVMVARMLHQLTAPTPGLQFAILRAARAHLELGGPARLKHTYPALAFCGLKALRRLTAAPQSQESGTAPDADAAADANAAVTEAEGTPPAAAAADAPATAGDAVDAESALQWLLEVALQLAEVPAPMQALRLLLVCAHVSSEEAGLEMLAYEFFEQVREPAQQLAAMCIVCVVRQEQQCVQRHSGGVRFTWLET